MRPFGLQGKYENVVHSVIEVAVMSEDWLWGSFVGGGCGRWCGLMLGRAVKPHGKGFLDGCQVVNVFECFEHSAL